MSVKKVDGWLHRNYDIIRCLVERESRVLDLGCGDGSILRGLKKDLDIRGLGVEIDEEKVVQCMANGVAVVQADIDAGLSSFKTGSFDYVVLNRTLQTVKKPHRVLEEMLRVGRYAIVGFPNFAFWKVRLDLLFQGRMPVTDSLPQAWYETENIHLCTIRDFRLHCRERGFRVLDSFFLQNDRADALISAAPNLLATEAVFLLGRKTVRR